MTERITISVPDELAEQINKQLSYGDNRSEWIREAIEQRLAGKIEQEEPEPVDNTPRVRESTTIESDDDPLRDRAEAALEELKIPGRPAEVERARREAVLWAWDWLREQGKAKPNEIANATFDEFEDRVGYGGASRYRGYQLWDNCLRSALRELPGVIVQEQYWKFDEEADR